MSNKIYYNINIPYDQNRGCDACTATVLYNSEETILDRGDDYYASVINFSLPVSSIPVMFCDIEPFPNTDVDKTIYKVALEHSGAVETVNLQFTQSDFNYNPPASPTATNPDVTRTYYHAIYTYSRFLKMVNAALKTAFLALPSTPVGATTPVMTYDASGRFSLITDATYSAGIGVPIKVYLGYELFQFFTGFDMDRTGFKAADGRDFLFKIISTTTEQDYSTISNWNCLRSLQLRAPGMDVSQESVPSSRVGSNGKSAKASILASFNPLYDNTSSSVPRSQIQFSLNSAHRLIDVLSSAALTRISLEIWWTDEQNNSYPLIMNYRELIQLKLCFHLKDSFVG